MSAGRQAAPTARATGETRDSGWEIGVRRTLPEAAEALWVRLVAPDGVRHWLGARPDSTLEAGAPYRLADGTRGEVRVWRPALQLRLTRHAPGAARASTVQLRLVPAARGTTVAFHEEQLPDGAAREARRAVYVAAIDALRAPPDVGAHR